VSRKWSKGSGGPAGDEHYNMVVEPRSDVDWATVEGLQQTVGTLCSDTHPGAYSGQDAYTGRLVPHEVRPPCHPLAAGAHPPAIAFHPRQDPIHSVEVTHALSTGQGKASIAVAMPAVTGTLGARASSGGGFSTDFEVAGGLQPTPMMASHLHALPRAPSTGALERNLAAWARVNRAVTYPLLFVSQKQGVRDGTPDYLVPAGKVAPTMTASHNALLGWRVLLGPDDIRRLDGIAAAMLNGFIVPGLFPKTYGAGVRDSVVAAVAGDAVSPIMSTALLSGVSLP
jgi:hypothetical protein